MNQHADVAPAGGTVNQHADVAPAGGGPGAIERGGTGKVAIYNSDFEDALTKRLGSAPKRVFA